MASDDGDYRKSEFCVRLGPSSASRAVWQDITELGIDLAAAIAQARRNGMTDCCGAIVFLHDIQGVPLDEIAEQLGLDYGTARRYRARGLKAIRDTGLLKGYGRHRGDS